MEGETNDLHKTRMGAILASSSHPTDHNRSSSQCQITVIMTGCTLPEHVQPWPSGYAFYNISFRLFFRSPCGNLPELSTIKTLPISHLRSLPGLAGESGLTAFLSSLLPPEAETSWCNTALWIHHLKNAGRLQRICWGSSDWQTRRSVRNTSEFN